MNQSVGVHVRTNTIADPYRQAVTENAIRKGIGGRQEDGEYEVSITARDGGGYHITIDGPEGTHVDRDFSTYDDWGVVFNFVEQAIPRDIPTAKRVLCDVCIRMSLFWSPMSEIGSSLVFECPPHQRIFHPHAGYISLHNQDRPTLPRLCDMCQAIMYIEFADFNGPVRLRCPDCSAFIYAPRPLAHAGT